MEKFIYADLKKNKIQIKAEKSVLTIFVDINISYLPSWRY